MPETSKNLKQSSTYILSAGFGSVLGLIVILTLVWYTNIVSTQKELDLIVNTQNVKISLIIQMRDAARARALSLHRLRILQDPFKKDEEYSTFKTYLVGKFIKARIAYLENELTVSEKEIWNEAIQLIRIGQTVQDQVADLILENRFAEADIMLLNQVIPAQNQVLEKLTQLLDIQRIASRKTIGMVNISQKKTQSTTIILGSTAIVLGIFIAILVIRKTSMAEVILFQSTRSAQESNRLKSEFLAKMSHELRTPLNAIIGFSEVLEEDAREDGKETYVKDLKKIQTSGQELLSIINNVLDLSKLEAGKLTLNLQDFSIKAMIEHTLISIGPVAVKTNNKLVCNCDDDIGIMYADELRIRQSLFNLLNNACKFCNNGVVTLNVEKQTANHIEYILFKVSDTGIGIDHDQLKNLFQPFSQLDSSINRQFGGTGLGLILAQRFCKLMDGDIIARSQKGVGSTFTIKLPMRLEKSVDHF